MNDKKLAHISILWYNRYMNNTYKRTHTTVSLLNYHFVFCPRYRRKVFLIDGLEVRFKELVAQICKDNDIDILAFECHIDHCHIFLSAPPKLSPATIMKLIKGGTGAILRNEFASLNKCKQLWTRSYFVSTAGNVSSETIRQYVDTQKTKGPLK